MSSVILAKSRSVMLGMALIAHCSGLARAQPQYSAERLSSQEWFQQLPASIRDSARVAETLAKDSEYQKSIQTFQAVLAMKETQQAKAMFRSWIHQWLAYNYSIVKPELAREHVRLSLETDIDIWPDHLDRSMHSDVRILYQECYAEIFNRFRQKRHSWRFAAGTMVRADYSYRFAVHFDVAAGIGRPLLVGVKTEKGVDFQQADQTHFYVRVLRMRKNIERLTGGFYLEYSLVHDFGDDSDDLLNVLSCGPMLTYSHKSGWEYGGVFSIAQLAIKAGDKVRFSSIGFSDGQTDKSTVLEYSNFEIYLRKWF